MCASLRARTCKALGPTRQRTAAFDALLVFDASPDAPHPRLCVPQAAELKFNCFFLMPLVDSFPARLRKDIECAYEEVRGQASGSLVGRRVALCGLYYQRSFGSL